MGREVTVLIFFGNMPEFYNTKAGGERVSRPLYLGEIK
jgi:hypothetical protein